MAPARILIVDDEIIIARELEARLTGMGYQVLEIASSGEEAIRFAMELEPDLVLMDIVLKGDMDGIEAATEIRRRRQIPIIYVTAYTDEQTLNRAKVTEPFAYLVKPFSERELNANIEMAIYKHRVETRLRRVEHWFAAAIDELADAVVATDRDGVITVFNPAAEVITEWRRDHAIGRRLEEVLRLVDRSNGTPVPFDAIAEGPLVCLGSDTLLIDRHDRTVPVDCTMSCIRDAMERPSGSVSVLRDPTGQRHGALASLNADVALAVAQGVTLRGMLQLCGESIVRNLNGALARIWTLSTTGDLLHLQASAGLYTHITGDGSSVVVGGGVIGRIARDRAPLCTNDIVTDLSIDDREWAMRERMISFMGYPLLVDDRLVGVMAMFARRPISENGREALASVAHAIAVGIERKRLEEQLRQIQKMEAIGQLAGGVAHDFNNLLTVISGCSQILMRTASLDDDAKTLVAQISAAGERAASLTRQLLAFSREQVLEPKVLDLNRLVANIEEMLGRLLGEGVSLGTHLDPRLGTVMADPGQIEQVIMNLAVNASDAMPEGGKLTIETSNVTLDESFTHTRPKIRPGNYVMLAVSDTGMGMTPEVRAHIFEPFFTTKGTGKGTGLGLATVYGIVRQSAGHIEVYSEVGIGTTFKIFLPAAASASVASSEPIAEHAMPKGAETILLVEDEHAVRSLARYILQGCGYTMLEAADGREALRISDRHEGEIHLVLTDVVLPEMGGRILSEHLAMTRPETKFLYMSGYTDDAIIRHGVLQAETAFLQKPFTPSGLAVKVREVLDHPKPSPTGTA